MVSVLGAPRIERDGAVVTFDTRKATALLGYLAVTGRPQRRETLAALLWPDADETRARSALRRTLSVIRKELGDLGPTITRDEVELVDGDDVAIDVRAFLAGAGSDDVEEVARAAALWRGDLLAGFSLRDSPDFDDWQAREAERLRRVMSSACARLVDARAAAGELDEAIAHAERWLDLDPLHEPAHRALMRLHAQRGDRAAAVHQYRACVRIVDEELGVAPLAETTALYEAITAGDARCCRSRRADRAGERRRWSAGTRSSVATRSSSSCSPRSVPAASSWSRASRASARPASSRRSLARLDRARADGALLRQRRRRALRAARRPAPPRGSPIRRPPTRWPRCLAPVAAEAARLVPELGPTDADPPPDRRARRRGPVPRRHRPGGRRPPAARPRACSSSTTSSGRTPPPSRCSPTSCTGAATTGPA